MTDLAKAPPSTASRRRRTARSLQHGGTTARVVLLAPFLLLFTGFFVLPIAYAIVQSLFTRRVSGTAIGPGASSVDFIGIDNYLRVLTDSDFLESMVRVAVYGLVQVPVSIGLALVLALALDSGVVRLRSMIRLSIFLPYAIPGVIAVIIWSFVYAPTFSPFVDIIHSLGFKDFSFVTGPALLPSIGNIAIWSHTGYNMIVILAALQAIPRELYEAARMDGAGGWAIAWRIKVPLVIPAIGLTMVFAIIGTIQLFSEPLVLKSIAQSIPSTFTPNLVIYTEAFQGNDTSYASALAVSLAVVSFVLSFGFLRILGRRSYAAT